MSLNIIGAGLGRTGTASLKVALEMLGTGHGYHMSEVLQDPSKAKDWIDAADGNADWDKIFDGYGSSLDYPGCTFWEELAEHYPDAKIILTVRDPVRWYDSVTETIMSEMLVEGTKNSPFGELMKRVVFDTVDNRMQDKDFMVAYFEKRNADIIASAPAERFLLFRVRDGWEPLCDFLGLPIPDEEFPHINSREETRLLIEKMTSGAGGMSEEAMIAAGKSVHGDQPD